MKLVAQFCPDLVVKLRESAEGKVELLDKSVSNLQSLLAGKPLIFRHGGASRVQEANTWTCGLNMVTRSLYYLEKAARWLHQHHPEQLSVKKCLDIGSVVQGCMVDPHGEYPSLRAWSGLTKAWNFVQGELLVHGVSLDGPDTDIVGLNIQAFETEFKVYVEKYGRPGRVVRLYADKLIKHVPTLNQANYQKLSRKRKRQEERM